MLKRVIGKEIAPIKIETKEQIRAGFQELVSDLGQIVSEWNNSLHPIIDSLPGGRTQPSALSRTTEINPKINGLDGSQVFMDSTADANLLGGILYNSKKNRPKTIKEVVLDNYNRTLGDINKLAALVDNLDAESDAYDDTDLKAWIRRLAANTVSNLDIGEEFGTGYFGGNTPVKTVQYSLHQRDANLRTLVGIDSGDYGLTSPGFSGTHYIDDDTIIQALIDLDNAIAGGSTTLQQAYDNGSGTIALENGKPVFQIGRAHV